MTSSKRSTVLWNQLNRMNRRSLLSTCLSFSSSHNRTYSSSAYNQWSNRQVADEQQQQQQQKDFSESSNTDRSSYKQRQQSNYPSQQSRNQQSQQQSNAYTFQQQSNAYTFQQQSHNLSHNQPSNAFNQSQSHYPSQNELFSPHALIQYLRTVQYLKQAGLVLRKDNNTAGFPQSYLNYCPTCNTSGLRLSQKTIVSVRTGHCICANCLSEGSIADLVDAKLSANTSSQSKSIGNDGMSESSAVRMLVDPSQLVMIEREWIVQQYGLPLELLNAFAVDAYCLQSNKSEHLNYETMDGNASEKVFIRVQLNVSGEYVFIGLHDGLEYNITDSAMNSNNAVANKKRPSHSGYLCAPYMNTYSNSAANPNSEPHGNTYGNTAVARSVNTHGSISVTKSAPFSPVVSPNDQRTTAIVCTNFLEFLWLLSRPLNDISFDAFWIPQHQLKDDSKLLKQLHSYHQVIWFNTGTTEVNPFVTDKTQVTVTDYKTFSPLGSNQWMDKMKDRLLHCLGYDKMLLPGSKAQNHSIRTLYELSVQQSQFNSTKGIKGNVIQWSTK